MAVVELGADQSHHGVEGQGRAAAQMVLLESAAGLEETGLDPVERTARQLVLAPVQNSRAALVLRGVIDRSAGNDQAAIDRHRPAKLHAVVKSPARVRVATVQLVAELKALRRADALVDVDGAVVAATGSWMFVTGRADHRGDHQVPGQAVHRLADVDSDAVAELGAVLFGQGVGEQLRVEGPGTAVGTPEQVHPAVGAGADPACLRGADDEPVHHAVRVQGQVEREAEFVAVRAIGRQQLLLLGPQPADPLEHKDCPSLLPSGGDIIHRTDHQHVTLERYRAAEAGGRAVAADRIGRLDDGLGAKQGRAGHGRANGRQQTGKASGGSVREPAHCWTAMNPLHRAAVGRGGMKLRVRVDHEDAPMTPTS